jgi:hypothetical protein
MFANKLLNDIKLQNEQAEFSNFVTMFLTFV